MEQDSESYYLKWNHFQLNICSTLENFHMSEDFVDVTLYCEGISLKAHKVILSACSSYFRTIFKDHQLCPHPVIILKGIALEDLTALLTFMYQGEVNIPRHRLSEFIQTARLLQIKGLCDNLGIEEHQDSTSKQSLLDHVNDHDFKKRKQKHSYGDPKLAQNDSIECSKRKQMRTSSASQNDFRSTGLSESILEGVFKPVDITKTEVEKKENDNSKYVENSEEMHEKQIKKENDCTLSCNASFVSDNESLEHVTQDESCDMNINDTNELLDCVKKSEISKNDKVGIKEDENKNTSQILQIDDMHYVNTERAPSQDLMDGGSILHRSLTGDHTVKPAESLVITPDLPISDPSSLLPVIKREPEESINISEPPPLVPLKATKTYLKPQVNPYNQILKDRLSPVATASTNISDNKQNCSEFSEVNLTKTLKILKNNPQISVLSEKKTEIDSRGKTPEILIKLVSQTSSCKTIMANKTEHKNDACLMRKSTKQNLDSTSMQNPILAQNLIQTPSPPLSFSQSILKTKNQRHVTSPSITIAPSHKFNMAANQTSLQKHSGNQSTTPVYTLEHILTQAQCGQGQTSSHTLTWNCPHCKQEYHNQSALKYHVRLVHSDFTNRLCCYLCPTSFTMRESYKAHMLEAHGIRN